MTKSGVDPVITKMLDRYKLSCDAESKNREKGLKALKFRAGGQDQWDTTIWNFRQADSRPCESYNQIPQFIHQVTNDMRMNMPQGRFVPGNDGTKEVADIYEDLARNIQSSSEAEIAFDIAADSQVTIGWGYFRVYTDYENEKSFDQIIKIGAVRNPFTVYDDPNASMNDKSDRRYLIQTCDDQLDDFNEQYDRKYSSEDLSYIGDHQPDWATDDTVRVAEYWTIEEKKSKLYRIKSSGKITEIKPKGPADYEERDVIIPQVKWRKCTAKEVLEERDWPGIYIPYIFVSGEELNIDGNIQYSGLVEAMIPAQKMYNYWANAATEMVALAPKSPFIAAVGQLEGLEKFWDNANTKSYPWLPYNPVDVNGTVLGAPQRVQNSADISSMMVMVQQAQQNLYLTSGISQSGLGLKSNESSGKAILARQREGDVSTFHFSDNMARAIRFMCRVMGDLIPKIYDAPRTVTLLKEDKSQYKVTINQPYEDERGERQHYDLTVGVYDVMVTTGPSFTTKRQEAAESMTALVQADPTLMQKAPDLIVSNYDFPGAEKLAERLKKFLPPGIADEDTGEIPPEVQMQLQQQQEAIQQLEQIAQAQQEELQSKQADIEAKQMDTQVKMQDSQYKAQSEERKAMLDEQKLALDAAKIEVDREKLALEEKKLEVEAAKMRIDAKVQMSQGSPDLAMSDPDFHEGPPPMLQMMDGMMSTMAATLTEGLQAVAQITAQSSQAIVESNMVVAQSNQQVANAINTPKAVLRDDQGRVAGIQ